MTWLGTATHWAPRGPHAAPPSAACPPPLLQPSPPVRRYAPRPHNPSPPRPCPPALPPHMHSSQPGALPMVLSSPHGWPEARSLGPPSLGAGGSRGPQRAARGIRSVPLSWEQERSGRPLRAGAPCVEAGGCQGGPAAPALSTAGAAHPRGRPQLPEGAAGLPELPRLGPEHERPLWGRARWQDAASEPGGGRPPPKLVGRRGVPRVGPSGGPRAAR